MDETRVMVDYRRRLASLSSFMAVAGTIAAVTGAGRLSAAEIEGPPSSYRLTDVTIEYSAFGGPGVGGSVAVRVAGSGKGSRQTTLRDGDEPRVETLSPRPEEVVGLLDLCYRKHFFDLRPSYGGTTTVRLGFQGEIEILSTVVADAGGRNVTVRIGSYVKSVSFLEPPLGEPPPVVLELARGINEIAARRESKE